MTLTFDLMTVNVNSASAVPLPNYAHVASPLKLSLAIIAIPKFRQVT